MAIPFSLPSDGNILRQKRQHPSKPKEVKYLDSSQSNSLVLAVMVEALDKFHCLTFNQGQDTDNDSDSTSDIKVSQQKTPLAAHGMSNTCDLLTNLPDIIPEAEVVTGAINRQSNVPGNAKMHRQHIQKYTTLMNLFNNN